MNLANLLAQAAPDIIAAITGSPANTKLETLPLLTEDGRPWLTAVSGLKGDVSGVVSLRCTEETARRLFDRVVHSNAPRTEDSLRNLIAEVLDLLMGQIKAGLTYQGKSVEHSTPSVLRSEEETGSELMFDAEPPILLETDVGRIEIRFVPLEESV